MSWQTYVDELLMCDIDGQGQHLAAAAIIGHDGSVWAQSSNFPQVCIIYIYIYHRIGSDRIGSVFGGFNLI